MCGHKDSFSAGNLSDLDHRVLRLETACFYLGDSDIPSLDFELSERVERLLSIFARYTDPEGRVCAIHSLEERLKEWRLIRSCLRRVDGRVFDKELFDVLARDEFHAMWDSADQNGRESLLRDWLLNASKEGKSGRLKHFILNLASLSSGATSFESKTESLIHNVVGDSEAAFCLWEYSTALDDYGFSDEEEARELCERTIDFFRRHLPVVEPESTQVGAEPSLVQEEASLPESRVCCKSDDGEDSEDNEIEALPSSPDSNEDQHVVFSLGSDGYYPVSEGLAQAAQEANSFRPYVPNSATFEYRKTVDSAREVARHQKTKVDSRHHARIDRILDLYERQLAAWYDKYHRNAASCPSIMVAGAGNFPRKRHEKKVKRAGELLREHEKLTELTRQIESVGYGGISSDDVDAIKKLESKLAVLKERHEAMKTANAYLRKHGSWEGYDGPLKDQVYSEGAELFQFFNLPNSLAEIRRIEGRIKFLERMRGIDYGDGWTFDGGVTKANKEANRLQIFFNEIPSDRIRTELRRRGFHWSPRVKAWQRMLTPDAIYAAKVMGFIPKR